jgi:hypothetical protein
VGHDDPQAAARRGELPDDVPRAAASWHREPLHVDVQPGAPEAASDEGVRAQLRARAGRPRPPGEASGGAQRVGAIGGDARRCRGRFAIASGRECRQRREQGRDQASCSSSSAGSVTGSLQAKFSQT